MTTVTISRIFRGTKDTRYGEKKTVAIQVEEDTVKDVNGTERGTKKEDGTPNWLSTFNTAGTENWKDGDKVDVEITENKGYLNFKPSVEDLEKRVKRLEDKVFGGTEEAENDDGAF